MQARIVALVGCVVGVYLALLLIGRRVRHASTPLQPSARRYALSLSVAIYGFLTDESNDRHKFLLSLTSTGRECVALAEVVALLSHSIVECRSERIVALSRAWHLEEFLTRRILTSRGDTRLRALHTLLALHPSQECVAQIARRHYPAPDHSFAQLLLCLYATPSRTTTLLARHPHTLTWQDMAKIVEVLKMHSPILAPLERNEYDDGANVDMLALYLSAVEGVGSPTEIASTLSTSTNGELRTAAFNVLFGEELFPTPPESNIGS